MLFLPKPAGKVILFVLLSFGIISVSRTQDSLRVDSSVLSNHSGLESILQGSVAGLHIKSWSGTPGAQSTLNFRGIHLDPSDQSGMPLILVNGVPIIADPSQVTGINPLGYFSSEQIERIEIVKEIDQLAALGVQAPNGALNFIIKEGQPGSIHVSAKAFAGVNFLPTMDYKKDAFYNFNTLGRRDVYGDGGLIHEQNILVDGAGSYGSYLFGLSNHQDQGIIKNSTFGRQALFLNARYNISDRLSAHFYNNMAISSRNGRYAGEYSRGLTLPVVADEEFFMDKNRNIGLLSSMGLSYQFSSALKISSVAGLSYEGASRDVYLPSNVLGGRIFASSVADKRQLITLNTFLNYHKDLSDVLNLDMKLGNEIRSSDNKLTSVDGSRTMEDGGSNFVKVVNGYNADQTNALSDHEMEKLVSYYGVWNWKYKKDLGINMVLRADGSSLYEKKWAFYPALGMHFNMKNSMHIPVTFNASWGKTGILSRPEVYRGQLDAFGDYYGGNLLGVGQLYPPFPDAKSISVNQLDLGLNIDLGSRISLSVDYFNKTYRDFTYRRLLPNISGIDYQYETGGAIGLSGVELNLDARWVSNENFFWKTNLNMALYKNKIKELPADIENTSLSWLGLFPQHASLTSLIAYEGKNPKVIGNSEPKAFGGSSNMIRLGNVSANIMITYAWGADVLAESFSSIYFADRVDNIFPLKSGETPYYLISQAEDKREVYQGIRTVEDGGFIRFSRADIAYHLKSIFKKVEQFTDMEIFLRGDNLLTLSTYSGINPEENITGIRRHDLYFTGTPLPATVALGIKVVF